MPSPSGGSAISWGARRLPSKGGAYVLAGGVPLFEAGALLALSGTPGAVALAGSAACAPSARLEGGTPSVQRGPRRAGAVALVFAGGRCSRLALCWRCLGRLLVVALAGSAACVPSARLDGGTPSVQKGPRRALEGGTASVPGLLMPGGAFRRLCVQSGSDFPVRRLVQAEAGEQRGADQVADQGEEAV